MNTTKSFGEKLSGRFGVGDIVSWGDLKCGQNVGMLYEIYNVLLGGRQVKKARIASFKDAQHYEVLLLELKIISKGSK